MDLKFPATEPDQTLCFENKRRIISDKHAAWMAQRERAIAQEPQPSSSASAAAAAPAETEAAAVEAVEVYEAEKRDLAKLPPARRRAAVAQKRASWMKQRVSAEAAAVGSSSSAQPRRGDVPAAKRAQDPGATRSAAGKSTAAPAAGRSVANESSPSAEAAGDGSAEAADSNALLAQLHAERQARAAAPTAPAAAAAVAAAARPAARAPPAQQQQTRPAAAAAAAEPEDDSGWSCAACTFRHSGPAASCEICGTSRPAPSPAAADPINLSDLDDGTFSHTPLVAVHILARLSLSAPWLFVWDLQMVSSGRSTTSLRRWSCSSRRTEPTTRSLGPGAEGTAALCCVLSSQRRRRLSAEASAKCRSRTQRTLV
eukprot:COSAG04_NODE_289_length_17842_cov_141.473483_3_plen_371_part_00